MKNLLQFLNRKLKKIPRPPIYGNVSLKLAIEFGVVLSSTAKNMNISLDGDMVSRAEKILIRELRMNGKENTALNFVPLILAALEVKENK